MAEDDDEVVVDVNRRILLDVYQDGTAEVTGLAPNPAAPEGWTIDLWPLIIPLVSSLLKRRALWLVDCNVRGVAGWIRSEIAGGPRDPTSAAFGMTMRLKCCARMDKDTPKDVVDDDGLQVAFTLDNYGQRWVLLSSV